MLEELADANQAVDPDRQQTSVNAKLLNPRQQGRLGSLELQKTCPKVDGINNTTNLELFHQKTKVSGILHNISTNSHALYLKNNKYTHFYKGELHKGHYLVEFSKKNKGRSLQ